MGGAGLPGGIILPIILVLGVLLLLFVVLPWMRTESRHRSKLVSPETETLEYRVPEGQDPAAVVAALRKDGLDAMTVSRAGDQLVLIGAEGGVQRIRGRARAVIAHESDLNIEGDPAPEVDVRFTDE